LYYINKLEKINPFKATVIGAIKGIPKEHPNLAFQNLDIFSSSNEHIPQITKNIFSNIIDFTNNEVLALRNQFCWKEQYEKISLPKTENLNLKKNGVYLITGGLGGIGLNIALLLAKTIKANLILLSRTPLPLENTWDDYLTQNKDINVCNKIKIIKEITSLGSKVKLINTDISHKSKLKTSLAKIKKTIGEINGIIHTAGVKSEGLIFNKPISKIEEVFLPKIQGTLNLANCFKNKKLDFFILFSSLNAIDSWMQQIDYSAANAFLNSFAHYNSNINLQNTLALDWPGWADVGMFSAKQIKENLDNNLANLISCEEGLELFKRCLNLHNISTIIISPNNLNIWLKDINKYLINKSSATVENNNQLLSNIKTNLNIDSTKFLSELWSKLLGQKSININDDFFELGGHSLMALEIISEIKKTFNLNLQLQDIYNYSSLKKLADYIDTFLKPNDPHVFSDFFHKDIISEVSPLAISLRKGKTNTNLFLLHPVGGNVLFYYDLVKELHPDLNIIGIRSQGFEDNELPLESINEMATVYLDIIKKIQPQGPYYLAGHSFGGVLAYDIAQKLKLTGQKIQFLSLIDTPGPNQLPELFKDDADYLKYMFDSWLGISIQDIHTYKKANQQQKYLVQCIEKSGKIKDKINAFHIDRLLLIFKKNMIAMHNYKPLPYQGDIIFVKAETRRPQIDPQNPELAWQNVTKGKFSLHTILGDHISIIKKPHVLELSNIINQYLKIL
jgi:thioesterase domain-containing protein/acyl carrier protein/NADP-dependent 3-hydroxy acid dehydrogenase YdfG